MWQGALINPTLGPPAELPLREGPPQVRRPEGRDLRGPEGPARPWPARLQEHARPEGQGRQLPVVRKERRPEGQRPKEAEMPVVLAGRPPRSHPSTGLLLRRGARVRVPARQTRQCIRLPRIRLMGPVPETVPVRQVPVSLGGTGKLLLPSRPTEESSTSMTMILVMTRPRQRSRGKC